MIRSRSSSRTAEKAGKKTIIEGVFDSGHFLLLLRIDMKLSKTLE